MNKVEKFKMAAKSALVSAVVVPAMGVVAHFLPTDVFEYMRHCLNDLNVRINGSQKTEHIYHMNIVNQIHMIMLKKRMAVFVVIMINSKVRYMMNLGLNRDIRMTHCV